MFFRRRKDLAVPVNIGIYSSLGLLQCKDDHQLVIIWQFIIKIQDSGMTLCSARKSLLRTENGIAKWDCLEHSWGKREMEIKITGWGHNVPLLVSIHSKLHGGRRGEWLGCARSDLLMSSSFHPSLLWACLVYLCMCNTHIVYVKHVMRKLFIKFHGLNKFSNTPPTPSL